MAPLSKRKLSAPKVSNRLTGRSDSALKGSDPSALELTSESPSHTADQRELRLPETAAGAHGAHTRKFEAGIRQWPTDGLGGENIYHHRRPSVRTNCRHSRMQVDSQAVWTRPLQGSDPSALELTSVSPCHTAKSAGAYDSPKTAAGMHGAHKI
jgi:hypothetical protein